jgi:predicted PhzF superfamily epimerase YddE/YHI9
VWPPGVRVARGVQVGAGVRVAGGVQVVPGVRVARGTAWCRALEGRHGNNDGIIEDVATGSAAGCVAAYLMRHERILHGETVRLHQGRFAGRPSRIGITAFGDSASVDRVVVAG